MKISVQTDNLRLLREALSSSCSGVRFGSEFCEHLLPNRGMLEKAHELAFEEEKEFTYVTSRLSNAGIERLRKQLPFLSEQGGVGVVVNDFGALHMLRHYANLRPHLGRHLFRVPARRPWTDGIIQREDPSSERARWIRDLYSTTSLNYQPTIELYHRHGCQRADVDWIPRIFPSFGFLVENGIRLSVHLHLVPVTFTRKCHTARFLGEKSPGSCSRPCLRRAFVLKSEVLEEYGLEFVLHGNTVFRVVQPLGADAVALQKDGVDELVLAMNPVTGLDTARRIDDLILSLGLV
jgi:hypothetical protein